MATDGASPTRTTTGESAEVLASRIFAGYLALQAIGGIVLWSVLILSPEARSWIELLPEHAAVTDSFFVADAVVVVASATSAWMVWRRSPKAVAVAAFTAGCLLYPTLFLVMWLASVGTGWFLLATMIPASTITSFIALHLLRRSYGLTPVGSDDGR